MESPLDPWHLASRLGARIHYTTLGEAFGYTDGDCDIWLSKHLNWVEARVTLYHELTHIIFGHKGHQPPDIETHVRRTVAQDLIPWHHLIYAARHGPHPHHIADQLDVTPAVLRDRIHHATPRELNALRKATPCDTSSADTRRPL